MTFEDFWDVIMDARQQWDLDRWNYWVSYEIVLDELLDRTFDIWCRIATGEDIQKCNKF